MTRETLIGKTLNALQRLPREKVGEIADFACFLEQKYDDEMLQQGVEKLVSESQTFDFLRTEPDLYSPNDLKEKYQ